MDWIELGISVRLVLSGMHCENLKLYESLGLKITKVQLELLSDPDMLLMIEGGIRGGIATISHRHAKANNEYMGTEFDPAVETKFISYLDANNLYGWAMSKQLPTTGFE